MTLALGFPNRFSNASLSGVGWTSGLPLSYLSTRQLSQVARSLGTSASFYAAFGSATEANLLALLAHNLSVAGQWRVRGFAADPRPTLELAFSRGQTSGLSLTRGSSATYIGSDGLLKTAGNNVPRITHDLATRQCLGLLLEAGTTNYITDSRRLNSWTNTNSTSSVVATGVDGSANAASRVRATSANGRVFISANTGNNQRTFSAYVRRTIGSGAVRMTADNFANKTDISGLTTEWKRFEVTVNNANTQAVGFELATSGDEIEVDYTQCEVGPVATSAILTTAGTATRSADSSVSYAISGLPALTTVGALVLEGRLLKLPTSTMVMATLTNGSQQARFTSSSAAAVTAEYVNTSSQCLISLGTLSLGTDFAAAFSYAANDFKASLGGTAGTADTSGTVNSSAATAVQLADVSSAGGGIVIASVRAYAANKTQAELDSLSGSASEHAADYDSGLVDAWPSAWVSGTTAEERSGARGVAGLSPASAQTYQYWRFDILDPTNSAGYVQLGRVFMGTQWRPERGAATGASLGYESRSTTTEADDGAEYHTERRGPRVARFNIEAQTQEEAMRKMFEMQRQLGATGEVLFQWDTSDTLYQPARTFLGRLRSLSPLTAINSNLWSASLEIKELL